MSETVTDVAPPVPPAPLFHLGHPDHHIPGYEIPETASPPPSRNACIIGFVIAAAVALLGALLRYLGKDAPIPPVAFPWVLPFAALLASIAIMPFVAKHFWEKNYQNVSVALALLVIGYYVIGLSAQRLIAQTFSDYISFIFLLGSLFVVSGGVIIRIHRRATPAANTALLLIGAILANVFGTTGASMLLIRPFLRLNKTRPRGVRAYHVVFFIFAVANVGGALTPVGDPPLFLGYLKGVPFWWVVEHAWPIWLTAVGCLVAAFYVIDTLNYRRERAISEPVPQSGGQPGNTGMTPDSAAQPFEIVSIFGAANIVFIAMILGAVFLEAPFREILMAAAAFGSLATTSRRIYGENHFNYAPIKEVALLFIGIFATMIPAMNYLHNHANDPVFKRNLNTPGQFYFASGTLSSVLDNAPTYVTFLETALGKIASQQAVIDREKSLISTRAVALSDKDHVGLAGDQGTRLKQLHSTLLRYHGTELAGGTLDPSEAEIGFVLDDSGILTDGAYPLYKFLIAISMGAVFFGACTYIGNGPNFMVKSIADHAGVKTPSFFAYILFFTLPVLLPILILCWLIFLR